MVGGTHCKVVDTATESAQMLTIYFYSTNTCKQLYVARWRNSGNQLLYSFLDRQLVVTETIITTQQPGLLPKNNQPAAFVLCCLQFALIKLPSLQVYI